MTQIIPPTNCPCCEYPLELVNSQLFCRNIACPAQLSGKLLHFCKVQGIKGMGAKTLEKLGLEEIVELYYLDSADVKDTLGEKIATKLLNEIEKSKAATLATVIESFSIPLIGGTASKKIASVVTTIEEITQKTCKDAGLGEKATANLLNWVEHEYSELKQFLPFDFQSTTTPVVTGKTVCITGKLKSYKKKADAENDLLAAGFVLVDSVTKTTDFLVDEEDGASTKRQKADKYGITIITDLNDLLKVNIK